MGRPKTDTPTLRRQSGSVRSSGARAPDRAFVELDGKRHYLGQWGSPDSKAAYHRLLLSRLAGVPIAPSPARTDTEPQDFTVVELVGGFLAWIDERHRQGRMTNPARFNAALKVLTDLYAHTAVNDFHPKHLLVVQQAFVEKGWHTTTVNTRVGYVKRLFRWGMERQFATRECSYALQHIEPLELSFEECQLEVKPVPPGSIEAVKPLVSRQVRAMIELQLLTGARPGEVCMMRPADLQTGTSPWEYRPTRHKNSRRGKPRIIYLGPQAQELLAPFLAGRRTDAFLFSPAEADQERRSKRHAERTTPLSCGNRPGTNRNAHPRRPPGERYRTLSYGKAIGRACKAATVPEWSPNQLRHNYATRIRAEYGLDVTSTLLGHSNVETTQIYAEQNHAKAREVARKTG